MKIVHFSDWHGELQPLPTADLYVCTGDMLPNSSACTWVDREPERRFQREWIDQMAAEIGALAKNAAPIIVVRGNHDYIDLAPYFREWSAEVYELTDDPRRIMINGLSFGGFRGLPPIGGVWVDELSEEELAARCKELGRVDVFITHGPAREHLDAGYGSTAFARYVAAQTPSLHAFGHIHEAAGLKELGGTRYSNAATRVNVIDTGPSLATSFG